jgi:hypothetical protein
MRYFEIMPETIDEGREPKLTLKMLNQHKQRKARLQAEQKAKQPLYRYMYAIESPHDLFIKTVERMRAELELKQLHADYLTSKAEAEKTSFDPIHKMATRQRKKNIGV